MRKHKDRKHAQWSASSTERNWLCPGNLAIGEDVPVRPENKAAAWGTVCHEVSEKLLKQSKIDIGDVLETNWHVFTVDQEMLDCAWIYVDYIRGRLKDGFNLLGVEQHFDLMNMALPMDIGGTADAVLHNPFSKVLEIVDLKTGKGKAVEAPGNPQERLYALGVLVNTDLKGTPVRQVMTTIVQPRLPHRDGVIRSETIHVADLMDWTIDLVPRVTMAAEALKTYATAKQNTVKLDWWVDEFLVPGEVQCTFCPAAGGCPALRKRALEITMDDNSMLKSNTFIENTVEGVEMDLDAMELLETWIRERRALAHGMAVQGVRFDHHVLVDKIGHRKFDGISEADIVDKIRERLPLLTDQLYDQKLKSPAGLEKAIGKAAVATHLGDLIIRPVTGTDLIRTTNTSRTAAATVADLIEELE